MAADSEMQSTTDSAFLAFGGERLARAGVAFDVHASLLFVRSIDAVLSSISY